MPNWPLNCALNSFSIHSLIHFLTHLFLHKANYPSYIITQFKLHRIVIIWVHYSVHWFISLPCHQSLSLFLSMKHLNVCSINDSIQNTTANGFALHQFLPSLSFFLSSILVIRSSIKCSYWTVWTFPRNGCDWIDNKWKSLIAVQLSHSLFITSKHSPNEWNEDWDERKRWKWQRERIPE